MVPIAALWLPILLSGVFVFVVSSIIHMALRYHKKDYSALPDEEAARAVLGKQNLARGQYAIPFACEMKQMREPATVRKYEEGPVALLTVLPKGTPRIGPRLIQWFIFSVVIAIFVAYVMGRTFATGTPSMQIFRFASTIGWLGYGGGIVWMGIWKSVPWSKVWIDVFDALVYGLCTGAAFGWFWPH